MRESGEHGNDSPLAQRVFLASIAVALLPIVVATIVAVHDRWVPVGDSAFFAVRARDVFSAHPPLLGTWTSASLISHTDFNNPGPLLFDALAIPTTITGPGGVGLFVGVALCNVASVLGLAFVARRHGGALSGVLAMTIAAVLGWTLGSAVLLDPTQPSSLLLPFLLLLALVWAITCNDLAAVPWAVGVASFLLQSYITYIYFVVVLSVWVAVVVVVRNRHETHRLLRTGLVAGAVLVACWIQPIIEQFTSSGPGNVTRLRRAFNHASSPLGWREATRVVARVVTTPPFWVRPSFHEFMRANPLQLPSPVVAALTLFVVVAALGFGATVLLRHGDQVAGLALATAVIGIVAALITTARIPLGVFSETAHVFRWLWPIAAFASFAILLAAARAAVARGIAVDRAVVAFAVVALVFAALNLPQSDQGANVGTAPIPVVRDLGRQMRSLHGQGPFLVDFRAVVLGDPYPTAMLAQLQQRSLRFVTDDPGLLPQIGNQRRYTGTNARARLLIVEGNAAQQPQAGATRVALHVGASPRDTVGLFIVPIATAARSTSDGSAVVRKRVFA